ncbi:MAG: hypothetical protein AAGJ28_12085, partial [Pseudomonadota bacterium]
SPGKFTKPRGWGDTITIKVHRDTGERLPDDAEGPHVLVQTYQMSEEPEILVTDRRIIKDEWIFKGVAAQLLSILPEGDDVPLAATVSTGGSGSGGGSGGAATQPSNVGLGTGGLY